MSRPFSPLSSHVLRFHTFKGLVAVPLSVAIALTAGCLDSSDGGGSSSPDEDASPANVGTFVDSRVSGLSYETASDSGETDGNGQFPYVEGETITFSIGDIALPEITVKRTITPQDVFDASDLSDTRVINLARYLQTIDSDGDPSNGILIAEAARTAASGTDSIDFDSPDFDKEIEPIIDASKLGERTLVSEQDAEDHLRDTLDDLPPEGLYFEVYGMEAGDYENRVSGRDLIGTSQGGVVFDVSAYDRFLIFVPESADQLFIDAVGYENGTQEWLDSIPGDEFVHRENGFDPFSSNPDCGWDGGCVMTNEANSFSASGEDFVEREPDDYAIASTPGENSYYQYSTFDADSMRVYLTSSPKD